VQAALMKNEGVEECLKWNFKVEFLSVAGCKFPMFEI